MGKNIGPGPAKKADMKGATKAKMPKTDLGGVKNLAASNAPKKGFVPVKRGGKGAAG